MNNKERENKDALHMKTMPLFWSPHLDDLDDVWGCDCFLSPCCWIPRLMLPRCRGPQGDQVRQCKVRSRVPALLTVCVLTQDRYRHPASNLHHHRNHLYAPAIHIPSLDSSVFIDLYFIILIYKYGEINAITNTSANTKIVQTLKDCNVI